MKFAWRYGWIVLALSGVFLWLHFGLPRYQTIDLAVNQSKALSIAKDFLNSRGTKPGDYKTAALFFVDDATDRYLQRTIGIQASHQFLEGLHYDLFGWVVRFFKEKQREEFKVTISSKSGEVIGFSHGIEDTAARPVIDKEQARAQALEFLKTKFGFDPSQYTLDREDVKKFDNRQDYAFIWRDNNVSIPWDSKDKDKGRAKLLTTVVISGNEVLTFNKSQLDIPEGFTRYAENLKQTGDNLSLVFRLMYLGLLTIAIMMVVNRKNHVVPKLVNPFYIRIGILLFIVMVADTINGHQLFGFNYPTSQSFFDYFLRQCIESLIAPFFIILAFILPAMAGESLRFDVWPQKKFAGFLSPILSSFMTRPMARQIAVGYAFGAFLLGIQALIFEMGYRYCGVWDELSWLTQSSSSVFPALTALLIGLQASFCEETMFRLFAINLFKKYGLPTLLAVFVSAIIWGFGHTGYAIFPMWFRGIEVTCLGLVLGFAYLRYGLVTAITAHFLMDAFLTVLPYLLKPQASWDFFSSLTVIFLPMFLALAAFILNRSMRERPMALRFNSQQEFNYQLLQQLSRNKTAAEVAQLKEKLLSHGWDPVVVDRAFNEM